MRADVLPWLTGAVTLVSFCATIGLMLRLRKASAKLRQMAGGRGAFDSRYGGYSVAEARDLLRALGPAGRAFYERAFWRFDMVFPVAYGLFFFLAFRWFVAAGAFGATFPDAARAALLALPIVTALFDYAENLHVKRMLDDGEAVSDALIKRASAFTRLKGVAALALLAAFCIALLGWVVALAFARP